MKVIYLRGALRDLEAIRAYIAQDDPDAARRVVARIERSIDRLVTLPFPAGPVRVASGCWRCPICHTSSSIALVTMV